MSGLPTRLLEANPRRSARIVAVGREKSPLVCIDDVLENPDALVAAAGNATFIEFGSFYPGVRASAPGGYVQTIVGAVAAIMREAFGAPPDEAFELCAFSMVTTPPAKLKPVQRIPHFDGAEAGRFAFIHYLCDERFGGTSFYRHRATGFECVTEDRLVEYRESVARQLREQEPARAYVRGDTELFERIHAMPAAFDRLVIYKGNALHSGDIHEGTVFSEDARRGRLTINGFGFLAR